MSQKTEQQTFLSPPPHRKLDINNTHEKKHFEDKSMAHEALSLKYKGTFVQTSSDTCE